MEFLGFVRDACRHLPPEWDLVLTFRKDELWITLTGPDGREIDVGEGDDEGDLGMCQRAINVARRAEGMPALYPECLIDKTKTF